MINLLVAALLATTAAAPIAEDACTLPTQVHIVSKQDSIDIEGGKIARLYGNVCPKSAAVFTRDLIDTASIPGPRIILINSNGGEVPSGQVMINLIEKEKRLGIRTICLVEKNASSMAFNFLTHCDVRLAVKDATMLVHKVEHVINPKAEVPRRLTARNLTAIAHGLELSDEQFRQDNAKAMRLSIPDYDGFADAETYWNAEVLLASGYLHGICTVQKK